MVSECHVLEPRWMSPPVSPPTTDGHTGSWLLPSLSTHYMPLPIPTLDAVEDSGNKDHNKVGDKQDVEVTKTQAVPLSEDEPVKGVPPPEQKHGD